MEKYKIKVLKDTPFNKAGTELSISDFRVNYNYICTNDVSDDDLISQYCDGDVLIGRYNCYYHINTWKLLYNVYANIQVYINTVKSLTFVDYRDTKSSNISNTIICELNGLKVGCKMISHKEVIEIARQLEIIA